MPAPLLAGAARYGSAAAAPPARTLLDVLDTTVARHPAAAALDDGVRRLDYRDLRTAVTNLAERLWRAGVGRGDRVGVRIPSGTADLYIAVLGVLACGAAYVPVDVDDPEERAALVFGEARVRAVLGQGLSIELRDEGAAIAAPPRVTDDAWIIFTSGSTGTPKGVAVTHRSAAAFVDAEARVFLQRAPLGPGDRVLAGLSVAFDASCEEMWLAWRHGACLVPAPRSLVRSGVDLGPWLLEQRITAVSTVPTLAALWPVEALDHVRLLIFGGEACPPELAERLAVDGREVWNTYGPTEATVVATAAPLTGTGLVRIGLPLDGWELAVIDSAGNPVGPGESGELVIAGIGLARYLDPEKDAAKYAALPAAGWERAYRSGDLVRADPEGLVFLGRADEQIKLGGRRIELGEIDAALQALPGVAAAAAAVKGPIGGQILVGYVVPSEPIGEERGESGDGGQSGDGRGSGDGGEGGESGNGEARRVEGVGEAGRGGEAGAGTAVIAVANGASGVGGASGEAVSETAADDPLVSGDGAGGGGSDGETAADGSSVEGGVGVAAAEGLEGGRSADGGVGGAVADEAAEGGPGVEGAASGGAADEAAGGESVDGGAVADEAAGGGAAEGVAGGQSVDGGVGGAAAGEVAGGGPGVDGAVSDGEGRAVGARATGGLFGPIPFDAAEARALLAAKLPAALVPRIAVVDELPTRTSGKVDRDALPWPLPDAPGVVGGGGFGADTAADRQEAPALTPRQEQLAVQWAAVLGERPLGLDADFFDAGGGSLAAARIVSVLRAHYPTVTVRDVYDNPSFRELAGRLAELRPSETAAPAKTQADVAVTPVPLLFQWAQAALMLPLSVLGAVRWLVVAAALVDLAGPAWAPHVSWWWVLAGFVLFVSPPGRVLVAALGVRGLLRGLEPGRYPRGGGVHLRLWAAELLAERVGVVSMAGGPWILLYARALGARIGRDVVLHSPPPITGMLHLEEGAAIEPEVDLAGHWIDGAIVHVGPIRVRAGASVGTRSTLLPGADIGRSARIAPGSAVADAVAGGQHWAGSPAERVGRLSKSEREAERAPFTPRWSAAYGCTALVLGLLPGIAAVPALFVLSAFASGTTRPWQAFGDVLPGMLPATVVFLLAFALLVLGGVRGLSLGMRAGDYPLHSLAAWRVWTTTQLVAMARVWLYPLYASVATPAWLRLLGMRVGRDVELSTVLAVPAMTTVDNGAFLADDTMIAPYELADGRLSVGQVRIGKRVFVGNSGMVRHGRKLPKGSLVGVLSAAPRKAKRGKSYLGMPPERLRRPNQDIDSSLTYNPPRRLKAARAAVELCRIVPAACSAGLLLLAATTVAAAARGLGLPAALLLAGPVVLGVGVLGAALAAAAKWALVGRIRVEDQPLWSSFVWRNELADNFVELIAAPWFAEPWLGSAVLNAWLRALGAKIGRGVWCGTYWLPEADLIVLDDAATVNRGCVVQTHLFHDRVMSMDMVTLHEGATLGPQCVILPAAAIGAGATVGPASLVMRGEAVPGHTRWTGNPIAPWADDETDD